MTGLFSILAICCSAIAILSLWTAWRRRGASRPMLVAAFIAASAATVFWIVGFGAEIGIPLALESAAILAFAFILTRIELRQSRPARDRYLPLPSPTRGRWRRGLVRAVGAGPIGLAAAIGIGVLFATEAPLADATRLILAGLLVPSLWAAAMIWVLASPRTIRPAISLLMIAVATIGTSITVLR